MEKNKPPLGVKPHWLVYQKRIEDLNEAIERNAKYIWEKHLTGEERKTYFRYIARWAKEIEALARLETEMDAIEGDKRMAQYNEKHIEEKACEWISVKERLPDNSEQILIYLDNGNICVGYYDITDKHFIVFLSATTRAIYWMPLPNRQR